MAIAANITQPITQRGACCRFRKTRLVKRGEGLWLMLPL